ncbi:MAG: hypothetical protein J3R72DRAFT_244255 [Linnemannia gamsii]|nr:MAG: hypothetical protein J3R72DRAFT_244255 [Linnemannia gamsii]
MLSLALLPRQFGMASLIVGALCLKSVSAALVSTFGMGYATVDENTLYVHGGGQWGRRQGESVTVPQFYSLDLTISGWDTSSPPWKALPYNPNVESMTVSLDGKTLTTWCTPGTANYSIKSNSWTQPVGVNINLLANQRPATDPSTGTVYFPGGAVNSTIKYNFEQGQPVIESIPANLFNTGTFFQYSFVWCQARKSFILFTDDGFNPNNPFFEYTPSNSQWKALVSLMISEE